MGFYGPPTLGIGLIAMGWGVGELEEGWCCKCKKKKVGKRVTELLSSMK